MSLSSILSHLAAEKAVIFPAEFTGAYVAYPNGDRRRRPICWLEAKEFTAISEENILQSEGHGFRVKESAVRRVLAKKSAMAGTKATPRHHQNKSLEDREQFVFKDSLRTVQVNARRSPLRALAQSRRGPIKQGQIGARPDKRYLSTAEIEAGERFARDYEFGNMNSVSTQNYASSLGIQSSYEPSDLPENRLDARNRVMDAIDVMGPGLDKVVTAICVNELTLERLERTEAWLKNSGFTLLKLGLQRLVNFYGTEVGHTPK